MSKMIRFSPEMIEEMKQEFEKVLQSTRSIDGKFNYTKIIPETSNQKATLRFTAEAYAKMIALVHEYSVEVAWHCVVDRGENENEYVVSDILVYPQTVTSATVDMNETEYAKWRDAGISSGDERFSHLHGQGHSHVNMSTSPSTTDIKHQKEILDGLRKTGFYVFMIWNKRNERTLWIYDLGKNIQFEHKDITLEIDGVTDLITDAKKIAKPYVSTYAATPLYNGGYNGGYNKTPTTPVTPAKPGIPVTPKPVQTQATVITAETKPKEKAKPLSSVPKTAPSYYYDDEEEDYTSPFYVRDYYFGGR